MRRLSAICALAAAFSAAVAQELPARLDSIGVPAEMVMHWRVRPHEQGKCTWGIVWNVVSSGCFDGAEITLHDARYDDALGREAAELRVYSVRDGIIASENITQFAPASSMRDGGGSLRLRVSRGSARAVLEAGYGKPEISLPVSLGTGRRVGRYALCKADTLRDELRVESLPEPVYARFESVGSLRSHLAASDDANEAEWVYYDRDTDPRRLSLGGEYRFATVSDGSGGYDIVLVAGSDWPALRIKGRLRPTGFIGQYDLEWLDASGEPMGPDCSALITDASLLTLRFPLYGGSVRYRRAVATD